MPATIQAQWFGASATLPAGANAEIGVTWNKEDTQNGTTPINIPSSAGVNFSYLKVVQLAVTATSGTSLSNRTVRASAALVTGLGWHWKTNTQANWASAFNQQAGTKAPADTTGANIATTAPSGYTAITITANQYDNTAQATTSTGIGAALLLGVLLAVDALYGGGGGTASLGNLILGYDES